MANLGTKEKTPSPVAIEKQKTIVTFPNISLDSRMLGEVKQCDLGEKYVLTFVGTVSGVREADKWQIEQGSFKKGDVIADFKLIDGSIRPYRKDKSGKEI